MTDEKLLQQLKERQQIAMEELMRKYYRYVYTVVSRILGNAGNKEDIEELVQDSFMAIWEHASSIQKKQLRAYIGTTARNKAKNYLRNCQQLTMALDTVEIPDSAISLDDIVYQAELSKIIRKAINRLNHRDAEIFVRHYYYLQTAELIGAKMGIPRNTVLSRLARGRKVLQKTLNEEGLF